MRRVTDLTTEDICQNIVAGLGGLGIDLAGAHVTPQWREWRWIAQIDTERICHFASSDGARMRMAQERELLGALQGRLPCEIPSVLATSKDGRLQVRRMVIGEQVQNREAEVGSSRGWESIAESYGAAIASLHRAIDPNQAATLVQPRPENLPYPAEQLRPLADRWIEDVGLARQVIAILDLYAAIRPGREDRVLIHGDLMADNMVFDLSKRRFVGMFDFSEAEVADRHLDLKYIHSFGRRFAERLMTTYESEAALRLDRARPAVYHIACAVSHLRMEGKEHVVPAQKVRVEGWVRLIINDAF
jgi:aminoglycoside phosphotransferase